MSEALLDIRDLTTYFFTEDGVVKAVDHVDLKINRGEVLGLVGESACGKSTLALSIMRLILSPGKIIEGKIIFSGKDLLELNDSEMRHVRGGQISMVFQDPMSSLNPVYTIGNQISEVTWQGWLSSPRYLKVLGDQGLCVVAVPTVELKS